MRIGEAYIPNAIRCRAIADKHMDIPHVQIKSKNNVEIFITV